MSDYYTACVGVTTPVTTRKEVENWVASLEGFDPRLSPLYTPWRLEGTWTASVDPAVSSPLQTQERKDMSSNINWESVGKTANGGVVIHVTHIHPQLRGTLDETVDGYRFQSEDSPEVMSESEIFLPGTDDCYDELCLSLNSSQFIAFKNMCESVNAREIKERWCHHILKEVEICRRGRQIMEDCKTFDEWLNRARHDDEAREWVEGLEDEDRVTLLDAMMVVPNETETTDTV